jgi:hypothetical protein
MIYLVRSRGVTLNRLRHTPVIRFPFNTCYIAKTGAPDTQRLLRALKYAVTIPVTSGMVSALGGLLSCTITTFEGMGGSRPVITADIRNILPRLAEERDDPSFIIPLYLQADENREYRGRRPLTKAFRPGYWVRESLPEVVPEMTLHQLNQKPISACSKCLNVIDLHSGDCSPGSTACQRSMCIIVTPEKPCTE